MLTQTVNFLAGSQERANPRMWSMRMCTNPRMMINAYVNTNSSHPMQQDMRYWVKSPLGINMKTSCYNVFLKADTLRSQSTQASASVTLEMVLLQLVGKAIWTKGKTCVAIIVCDWRYEKKGRSLFLQFLRWWKINRWMKMTAMSNRTRERERSVSEDLCYAVRWTTERARSAVCL